MFNGSVINDSATICAPVKTEIKTGPFTAVALGSGGAVPCNDTLVPVGLTIAETPNTVPVGNDVNVQVKDIGVWKGGAAFAAGDPLASDATGLAVKAAAGKFILGFALEDCSAKGQTVKVQITKSGFMKS
mgnify:FL=1